MSPILPNGAIVNVHPLKENEALEKDSLYYIAFDDQQVFRFAIQNYKKKFASYLKVIVKEE